MLIVDPQERGVHWLARAAAGEYRPVEQSALVALGPDALADRIEWPE